MMCELMRAPFNVGFMLLLTDGSVLAQNWGTPLWWRLRPDRACRYRQGEWTGTATAAFTRVRYGAAVLGNGGVILAGGSGANARRGAAQAFSAEAYDPWVEAWTTLPAPDSWITAGDCLCCVTPEGYFMLGSNGAAEVVRWDPAACKWIPTGARRQSTEGPASWTLLPDGTILGVPYLGGQSFERFSDDVWFAGAAPDDGAAQPDGKKRAGATLLLADGTVLVLGVGGGAARLTPDPNPSKLGVWTPMADMPTDADGTALGGGGAALCLLPNGNVLCLAEAINPPADSTGRSVTFLILDPTQGGKWTLHPSTGAEPPQPLANHSLLLLPNGSVLVSDGTPALQIYEGGQAPQARTSIEIVSCSPETRPGSSNLLTGFGLTGLSQAAARGSGPCAATNYPIVKLRAPFPSDRVTYCATSGHSTMGVSTGRQIVSTQFMVPLSVGAGIQMLSVVSNGVASAETPINVVSGRAAVTSRATPEQRADGTTLAKAFGEEELFLRDLSEVHLLMDFISGRADKSLADLKDVCTRDIEGRPLAAIEPQQVIEEVCKISYPPEGGLAANAQQAAFMLMVKDKLNYLAQPARGLTVAFTSMFAGISLEYPEPSSWRQPKAKPDFYSARQAYPNLEAEARRFRRFYDRLPIWAVSLVAIIAFTNWDISVTSAVVKQITDADGEFSSLFSAGRNWYPTSNGCQPYKHDLWKAGHVGERTTPSQTGAASKQQPVSGAEGKAVDGNLSGAQAEPAAGDPHDFACEERKTALRHRSVAHDNLRSLVFERWLIRPVAFSAHLFAIPTPAKPAVAPNGGEDVDEETIIPAVDGKATAPGDAASLHPREIQLSTSESFTLAVLSGLNTIVVPTAFGWLGTLAGLMRSITGKVRDSVLAPRDYQIARVAIFLGMSAGLAVGLFFTPSDGNVANAKELGSTITVSAAGLSFLAGFGSEAFFTFLDGLLVRLLPSGSGAIAPPRK